MNWKKFYIHLIILIIFIFFIIFFCFIIFSKNNKSIKIGLMVSLTGIYTDLGRDIRDGALLAVEMINEKGGINKRPVDLIVKDNQFNSDTVKNNYNELLNENVVAVIGPSTSKIALDLLPIINEKKLTVIAPTPTSTKLARLDDFMIRMRPTNRDDAEAIVKFIKENFNIKKYAVIYDTRNYVYTIDLLENLQDLLANHAEIIKYPVANKNTDFKNLAQNIISKKPDIVIVILDVYNTSLLIQNLKILKHDIPIFVSPWGKSPKLIEFGGKWSEGIFTVDNVDFPLIGNNSETVAERFRKRFGREMDFGSVNGFDAVMIIKKALENGANKNNMKNVILEIKKFEGIQGNIIFDEFGDRVEKSFILKIENGRFKRIN